MVIDGPPRVNELTRSALLVADMVLIPVQPSPYDVWAAKEIVDLIGEAVVFKEKLKAAFVVNRKIVNTAIGRDVVEALAVYGCRCSPHPYASGFRSPKAPPAAAALSRIPGWSGSRRDRSRGDELRQVPGNRRMTKKVAFGPKPAPVVTPISGLRAARPKPAWRAHEAPDDRHT